jgi:hypothetical protein
MPSRKMEIKCLALELIKVSEVVLRGTFYFIINDRAQDSGISL